MIPADRTQPHRAAGCSTRSGWRGFECSCQINSAGRAAGYDGRRAARYPRARGLRDACAKSASRTARDGLRWHLIDRGGELRLLVAGSRCWRPRADKGVQVIWDLCHYGWPDDLDIFRREFRGRVSRVLRERPRAFTASIPTSRPLLRSGERDLVFRLGGQPRPDLSLRRGPRWRTEAATGAGGPGRHAEPSGRWTPGARMVFPEPLIHNVPPR